MGRGLEEGQMAVQTDMEVRNSPVDSVGNNGELVCFKTTSVVADMAVEAEWQGGSESNEQDLIANGAMRVGVTDRMGKGHSVANQMEFEEGVGPLSL